MPATVVQYRLETFLRGRLGTDANTNSHTAADDVVVIDNSIKPRRLPVSDIGRTLNLKFLTSGQALDQVPVTEKLINGNSLKPLAPVNIHGIRNSDGDVLIRWTRRARFGAGLRPFADVPIAEEREDYIAEIYDGLTLLRTLRAFGGLRLGEPAQLVGAGPGHVSGNSVTNPGSSGSHTAHSIQEISQPGDWVEWTAKATASDLGAVDVSLVLPQLAQSNNVPGNLKDVHIRFFMITGDTGVTFAEDGVSTGNAHAAVASDPTSVRFRLEYTGADVRIYINYSGPGSVPVYTSRRALRLPYKLLIIAEPETQCDNVIFGKAPPSIVYTGDQQTQDFGSPQSSIKVRIAQVSAIVGPGYWAEAMI